MKIYGVPIPNEEILNSKWQVKGVAILFSDSLREVDRNAILIVKGLLTPAIVYRCPNVIAIISEHGSWNSHGVSLANANNIPCLVGVGREIENFNNKMELTLDFEEGTVTY
jgi:phosphohistidine swiveling domain-containing protein